MARNTCWIVTIMTIFLNFWGGLQVCGQTKQSRWFHLSLDSLEFPHVIEVEEDTSTEVINQRLEQLISPTNIEDSLRTRKMLDSLKSFSDRTKVGARLYSLLFVNNAGGNNERYTQGQIQDEYRKYSGDRVNSITLKQIDIFGTNIYEPSTWDSESNENFWGNNLTTQTRPFILKRFILQKEGEPLDAELLAESERLLRASSNIQDARVLVVPDLLDSTAVNVLIVTKDVFSIRPLAEISSPQSGKLGLEDRNFLGLAHTFKLQGAYDFRDSTQLGIEVGYELRNIRASFVDAGIEFKDDPRETRHRAYVDREFVSAKLRWAGGVDLKQNTIKNQFISRQDTIPGPIRNIEQDYWASVAFPLGDKNDLQAPRLYTTGRYFDSKFPERPFVSPDSNRLFENRRLLLAGLSLNQQAFYKSNLIRAFGQTEDVPVGWKISGNVGYQWFEFQQGIIYSAELSKAWYRPRKGYFYAFLYGSLCTDYEKVHNYAVSTQMKYISPLLKLGSMRLRNFFELEFSQLFGYQGVIDLELDRERDVRGLSVPWVYGDRKILGRYESVVFTPWQFIGFKVAMFAFADIAHIRTPEVVVPSQGYYNGAGAGLRIRNEELVFNTFQFRFGYYPNAPQGISAFAFDVSTKTLINWDDFKIRKPNVRFLEN
ncbi:hypothetical protein [Persicobacter diffluens]|uniref:Haemolysin activator HlyB C-terminal domain-containing protein n=1 Tax=Persicobacter diffluens TaxID=981 RepID=A0AAN4VWX2_9BACT|nr:hypothetical protein PEDI_21710 [Persicobacter diffluens]